jgi:hypothetical protein
MHSQGDAADRTRFAQNMHLRMRYRMKKSSFFYGLQERVVMSVGAHQQRFPGGNYVMMSVALKKEKVILDSSRRMAQAEIHAAITRNSVRLF